PWGADFTSESSSRNFRVAPPPKFPTTYSTSAYINWARRVKNYLITAGIGHTIEPNAPAIPVISRGDDEYFAHQYGAAVVREHRRAWSILSETTYDAPFEDSLYSCDSVRDVWVFMEDWCLPKIKAEKFLLSQQFETFEFKEGE
ncbi:unnamed protein product, partial [Pylaiella littoralis]